MGSESRSGSPGSVRVRAIAGLRSCEGIRRRSQRTKTCAASGLDGAYKQLADLRDHWSHETPFAERDRQYSAAVASLSEQLHRGEVPKGDVGPEDSRRVINAAARERNLVVREPEPDRIVQGEVLARSSQHTLVHVAGSDNVAIVYTRAQLERDIEPGEKLDSPMSSTAPPAS